MVVVGKILGGRELEEWKQTTVIETGCLMVVVEGCGNVEGVPVSEGETKTESNGMDDRGLGWCVQRKVG